MKSISAMIVVAACSNDPTPAPAPTAIGPAVAPVKATETPAFAADAKATELLAAASTCKLDAFGDNEYACPAREAMHDYAYEHQTSTAIAATCAARLRDPERRFVHMAFVCLEAMTSVAITPQLGTGLDALEAASDPEIKNTIAAAVNGAEAVTAKLDGRVIALVDKLAAVRETENAASTLVGSLFPSYMIGEAPKPPAAAQKLVLAALGRAPGPLMVVSFELVKMVDDRGAACAALEASVREDNPEWWRGVSVLADLASTCKPDVSRMFDVALAMLAKGDGDVRVMKRLDDAYAPDQATRAKVAAAMTASIKASPKWKRDEIAAAAKMFRVHRKG